MSFGRWLERGNKKLAEKEYIERGALLEILNGLYDHHLTMRNYVADGATQDCIEAVEQAPAADVVEVVRCKDCAFAKNNYLVDGLCICEKTIHDYIKGEIPRNTLMCEDDYCSYGERKEQK